MHIDKYKSQAIGNMINHYERKFEGTLKRENIDPNRTKYNYQILIQHGKSFDMTTAIKNLTERVAEINGRAIRKDANLLADLVLTKPENVPESDRERFFDLSSTFIYEKLKENGLSDEAVVKAYVHMDEKTPHMHLAVTPVIEKPNGKLAFNYKKVFPRKFYQTIHEDLQKYLEQKLGYTPDILREDNDKLKALSPLEQEEFKRVKDEIKAETKELLDEKKALERRLASLKKPLPPLKMSMVEKWKDKKRRKELQKELKNLKEQLSNVEKNSSGQEWLLEIWKEELEKLTKDVEKLRNNVATLKMKRANLKATLKTLNIRLSDAGLSQLKTLEKESENLKAKLEICSSWSLEDCKKELINLQELNL